ncbi:tyrosine recombinase XerS [Metabacillus fastidiosus]|uniref:Tyrosine recombinase XerS n=1 Tax=Metabacillus fastidiosus TaxID=1458 RepID=A0ABU6NYX3_9BACI|nr:tyrosine recombinase XerS [Metabacillus fastidiosus]MED4402070.1 tyrosine recombinase XerS [Metabacillus fastidiosus]
MANTRQHQKHKQKYKDLLRQMPEYVKDYVYTMENNHRSSSTLFNYLLDFKDFFEWLITEGIANVDEIKDIPHQVLADLPLDLAVTYIRKLEDEEVIVSKVETKTRERSSVNRKKSALRSLFKYLTTQYENSEGEPLFHRNVMQKISVIKEKESLNARSNKLANSIFQNDRDIDFLDYIKSNYENELSAKQKSYFLRDKERDYAILSLLLGSGIRVNELVELRIRDLNFENNTLLVIRKGGKQDVVTVFDEVMEDLQTYMAIRKERYKGTDAEHEYLFLTKRNNESSPITIRTVQDLVRKYTKAFNNGKRSMSPHKLRHTYATNLMDETQDLSLVMEQLGHTSETTALLYVHTSKEKAKKAAEALAERRKRLK